MKANEYLCSCCRKPKTISFFYTGIGVQNGKTLPICKECCKNKLDKYTAILGAEGGAWVLMAELGIPFIRDIWKTAPIEARKMTSSGHREFNTLDCYIKQISTSETVYQGFWDSDTMLDKILSNGKRSFVKQIDDLDDLEAMFKKWGKYDEVEAYEFLERTYNEYTEELIELDANLRNRYKDLCAAEYALRRAKESGDVSEMAKAQDNVNKLLKLLKLDDFKENKQSDIEKFIERKAWEIENIRPAECEDLDKYKDFSNFDGTWKHLMRAVKNLVAGTKEYPDIQKDT